MIVLTITITDDKRVGYINSPLQPGDAEILLDAIRLIERDVIKAALADARTSHQHTENEHATNDNP